MRRTTLFVALVAGVVGVSACQQTAAVGARGGVREAPGLVRPVGAERVRR